MSTQTKLDKLKRLPNLAFPAGPVAKKRQAVKGLLFCPVGAIVLP